MYTPISQQSTIDTNASVTEHTELNRQKTNLRMGAIIANTSNNYALGVSNFKEFCKDSEDEALDENIFENSIPDEVHNKLIMVITQ